MSQRAFPDNVAKEDVSGNDDKCITNRLDFKDPHVVRRTVAA